MKYTTIFTSHVLLIGLALNIVFKDVDSSFYFQCSSVFLVILPSAVLDHKVASHDRSQGNFTFLDTRAPPRIPASQHHLVYIVNPPPGPNQLRTDLPSANCAQGTVFRAPARCARPSVAWRGSCTLTSARPPSWRKPRCASWR